MGRTLLAIIVVLLLVPATFAIGFYVPEEKEFLFVPGGTAQYALGLVGAASVPISLEMTVSEPLRPFVQISETSTVLKPKEIKKILITVNFPQIEIEPGVYSISVKAKEGRSASGGFGASAAMRHTMKIVNPAQGIYPSARLYADNAQFEEPTGWHVDVINYGLEQVKSAYVDFEVYDRDEKLVAQGTTNRDSISFRETVELLTELEVPDGTPGRHTVKATVHADGWSQVIERDVVMGRPDIELNSYTEEFVVGRINEFQMNLRNIWEETLVGNARIELSAQGNLLSAQNPKIELIPWKSSSHSMFVNVPADIKEGEYNGVVELNFLDEPIEYPVTINFKVPQAPQTESPLSGFSIVPWAMIGLAVALVLFFVYRKRDKQEEEHEDDYL